ncbi:arylsulfatase [Mycobacterium sp. 852013-50091_SCH5140682]|uniref:arylsulfatase n=1 Tax=Mycobacterium sp. 852013-50091_SCH5140682 TaxID=1834109 RepID=UPI0007EA1FAD|nr:arylsulfatase [Mycobacterium sp. 852013-50091_SCH5140682]OBC00286.1 arylsulfatase [Mycobacterium sp. 852013-50091_SCH5140682]
MQQSRTHLPIPSAPRTGLITYDAKDPDTSYPPIEQVRPPAGAPNVLLILLDDVGFGASSAFGGPCATPTAERLATDGLKYNRFHTTALCSPTRQALLTGRNHHSAGMGGITEIATGAPGYSSVLPNTMSPIARTLKLNGYNTAQFGKCHEVPVWETSPVGPFDAWPSAGGGFEYFYGFLGGEANQWYPTLFEGTTPIEVTRTPEQGYHFMEDMTDKAIGWIGQQKALAPDKPFFVYFAPGATHAPHHVPAEWADKYKGTFDAGWDALREQTFARQKDLGVIPPEAVLTARHAEIPAWDEMPEELKPVLRRQMEVYAGFLEYTDHHVGRLVDSLQRLGVLDDTLVYYIIGDNGASAEGTPHGTFNEMLPFNGMAALETPQFMIDRLDQFGGPQSYNHYAVGWAHAMDTPYQWTKQVASHWGGTRNGTIVHWPSSITAKGEMRWQFHHVIDVAPTILEAAGLPEPLFVNGVQQHPIEGVSMLYSFNDGQAPDRHETQYFEMLGNRGIYHKGWTAVTKHGTPWLLVGQEKPAFDDDVWELYDTRTDWTQAKDLAKEMPEKLHELQRLWLIEATRYNVLPLDDDTASRMNSDLAGRPVLVKGNTQLLFPGMGHLSENCVLNMKNKSHAVTAQIEVPEAGADGVIIAQGANIGGWSLYAHEGKLKYCYNLGGITHFFVESADRLPAGVHQVRMEFDYDGGGMGKGGTVTLYVDGERVGQGRVEATLAIVFSADDGCDIGLDGGAAVSPDYSPGNNAFNGRVKGVQLAIADAADAAGHVVSPEDALRVAMARQ